MCAVEMESKLGRWWKLKWITTPPPTKARATVEPVS